MIEANYSHEQTELVILPSGQLGEILSLLRLFFFNFRYIIYFMCFSLLTFSYQIVKLNAERFREVGYYDVSVLHSFFETEEEKIQRR